MKHRLTNTVLALLAAGAVTAQDVTEEQPVAATAQSAVAGNNAFALKLYSMLRREEGNLFYSPLSARTALAMTWAGARGRTATQMSEVLCISGDGDQVHRALGDLARSIRAGEDDGGGSVLHTANSLWGQVGEPFQPSFVDLCADRYGASFDVVDFARATEKARRTINAWVSQRTNERIPELLKEEIIGPETVLVLTNAIDFQGTWATPFDPKLTSEQPFWLLPTDAVPGPASTPVPMMHATGTFAYHEDDALQVIELPYGGDALSMVVLLPRDRHGLTALERSLDPAELAAWLAALKPRRVAVHLPRFSARCPFRLDETLKELGMIDAFCGAADFSGMNGKRDLFISAVVHEAFVKVDEKGTEAAAATAVVMGRGSPRLAQFRADHPFLLLIRDRRSGAIVFLGRLSDPTPE